TLGGAMHDCAITAWGIKGWYDYIRPVSAIRGMAEFGQSSDPAQQNYDPMGIPLIPGFIELVESGDPLAGAQDQNVGKVKLYAWRGPGFIGNPEFDVAGVGWILAEMWWPYQRPSFITPNFAGFVSGHSTYSRAAAEVLTMLTNDPFFPGGVGEFVIEKDNFLVFERGPSVDLTLQWATYYDASDQTSLSRIWGGIHPPADDIPGRLIGSKIGVDAFNYARQHFEGRTSNTGRADTDERRAYPNPLIAGSTVTLELSNQRTDAITAGETVTLDIYNVLGQRVPKNQYSFINVQSFLDVNTGSMSSGIYFFMVRGAGQKYFKDLILT
ncbi:MAG: T9SS type A sorting domain-containing protein, partial [Calditrichota bacterium]